MRHRAEFFPLGIARLLMLIRKNMSRMSEWQNEGKDLLRGIAAGLIFGIPLLYTMEMWWHGLTFSPSRLMLIFSILLCLNTVICLFLGFRERYDFFSAILEAIEAVGLAVILSALVLFLIGELDTGSSTTEIFGKILTQAVVISLGVSIANAKFPKNDENLKSSEDHSQAPAGSSDERQTKEDIMDIGASIAGAVLFAFNVAPTEEVLKISSRLSAEQTLLLLLFEGVICYLILFASGFWKRNVAVKDSVFQKPFAETVICTAVSLVVAGGLIALVGQGDQQSTWYLWVRSTVVLGLPAVTGGAAGRLAL